MVALGLLLALLSGGFVAVLIIYNFSDAARLHESTIQVFGQTLATMSPVAIFCAGVALALIFCLGLSMMGAGARLARRRSVQRQDGRRSQGAAVATERERASAAERDRAAAAERERASAAERDRVAAAERERASAAERDRISAERDRAAENTQRVEPAAAAAAAAEPATARFETAPVDAAGAERLGAPGPVPGAGHGEPADAAVGQQQGRHRRLFGRR